MAKNTKSKEKLIYFSQISLGHWLFFLAVFSLAVYGMVQFVKPYLAERHYRDGYNLSMMNRNRFAIDELEEAVRLAPWESYYQVELGKMYEKEAADAKSTEEKIHYFKKARQLYQYTIFLEDRNPWYKNRLGSVYEELSGLIPERRAEYFELAEKYQREAANVDHNNPLFQLNYAYFLHRSGRLEEAVPFYVRTIEIDDRILEARYNLADILRKQGKVKEMLDQYLKIYEKNPSFNKVAVAIASIYIGQEEYEKAVPFLEAEVKNDANQKEVLVNLTTIYHRLGRWNDAIPYYRIMFEKYPELMPTYHQFYIQALANVGQLGQAQKELEDYLKEHPGSPVASYQLKKLKAYLKSH